LSAQVRYIPQACDFLTMAEILRDHFVELAIGLAGLLLMMLGAAYLVRRLRDRADDDKNIPSELITKYREMHSRGDLSETEYRTIKTVLATQFQDELNGTSEKG
jgi:hypothetical protein